MLKSRVTGIPDVNRIAKAMERPGIDPRCWNCVAYVTKFHIDKEGPLVDIVLVPDGIPETARVGADYAGPGFGLYTPIEKDTEVLVGFPNGDPDEGLVVTRRLWSASDPPPQLALDHPEDVILVAKEGANIRIVTQGGTVLIHDIEGEAKELAYKSDVEAVDDRVTNHIHVTTATVGATAVVGVLSPTTLPPSTIEGTEILKGQ